MNARAQQYAINFNCDLDISLWSFIAFRISTYLRIISTWQVHILYSLDDKPTPNPILKGIMCYSIDWQVTTTTNSKIWICKYHAHSFVQNDSSVFEIKHIELYVVRVWNGRQKHNTNEIKWRKNGFTRFHISSNIFKNPLILHDFNFFCNFFLSKRRKERNNVSHEIFCANWYNGQDAQLFCAKLACWSL